MWFKNISLYRLPADFSFDRAQFAQALQKAELKPIGPLEPTRKGFVSPFGDQSDVLFHESSAGVLIRLGTLDRVLPSAVVRKAVAEKANDVALRTGRQPGKKQRQHITDEVLMDLMPRAFVKQSFQAAYIDIEAKLLIVDSASDKAAEAVIKQLREGLGSFVAEPIQTEEGVSATMSGWVTGGKCAGAFELGDECELHDPVDMRSAIKAKRHDLAVDEIKEHLRNGKKVTQLALVYDARLTLVLDEKFKARKVKFLDIVLDEIKGTDTDAASELDTRFTLMVLEFRRLIASLDEVFKFL